jgi:hypothetical protein
MAGYLYDPRIQRMTQADRTSGTLNLMTQAKLVYDTTTGTVWAGTVDNSNTSVLLGPNSLSTSHVIVPPSGATNVPLLYVPTGYTLRLSNIDTVAITDSYVTVIRYNATCGSGTASVFDVASVTTATGVGSHFTTTAVSPYILNAVHVGPMWIWTYAGSSATTKYIFFSFNYTLTPT